jgi:hypothetical protein
MGSSLNFSLFFKQFEGGFYIKTTHPQTSLYSSRIERSLGMGCFNIKTTLKLLEE